MATPALPSVTPVTLDDTLGAAFLGHVATTLLYGITTLQTYVYYRDQKDAFLLRFAVAVLWLMDTLHFGLITGAMYWYCVTSFTNLLAVQKPVWPIPMMIVVSNVSNMTVRGIFGIRLYRLGNRSWILPGVIGVCSIYIVVDAAYFSAKLWHLESYAGISRFSWGLYAGLSVEAAVDLIVAISQCMLLRRFETGIQSTDSAIRVLIAYSINTGLLTSLCAIGALVSYAAMPHKFIYFAFYFVLSKLYVNSVLATLNARGSLFGKGTERRRRNKRTSFRTPSATAEPHDPHYGQGIEFTTVISAAPFTSVDDSAVETTTKTKIDSGSSYSVDP